MRIAREERLAILIVGMLILLAVVGWLAGTYFVNRYRQVILSPWRDPKATLRWQDVDPILALRELEGSSSQAVFKAALEGGDIETAYATLVYAIGIEPEERSGLSLLLAQSDAQDNRWVIQRSCYKMAASVSIAAPDMSDLTRATVLLEAGRGLTKLGASADALFYLDQAYVVAYYSDRITQAHRRALLDELVPLYRKLGRKPETWQALIDLVFTPTLPTRASTSTSAALERPRFLYLSDAIIQATASRQRMVQEVLQAAVPGQNPISRYQLDDLASVLRHEDRVRQHGYEVLTDQGQRVNLARDQVAWMVLKSRVAHRGFGLSIIPEWESQAAEIDAGLRAAQDTLYAQYRAVGGAGAQSTVLFLQLEHGLLGFYPDWPQAELAIQVVRLEPQRTLRVAARTENQNVYFFLVPDPMVSDR